MTAGRTQHELKVFTIGHSNHAWDRFLELLQKCNVEVIAEVRSYPYSNYSPQFDREAMKDALGKAGVRYVDLGKELGGRPDGAGFYDAERCIACLRADGEGWIRLVSNAEHGELTFAQRNLGDAGEPQNLDLIRVEVVRPCPAPGQPENWLIANRPWKLLQRPAPVALQGLFVKFLNHDDLLFGSATDRLCATGFQQKPPVASLALLKSGSARFLHEILGSKKRVRALFSLGKNHYNLSITDPPFEQALKCRPAGTYTPESVGVHDIDRLLLCASLGERFEDGNCYKLIAGVLQLPSHWKNPC